MKFIYYLPFLFLFACTQQTVQSPKDAPKVPDDAAFRMRAYPTGQINQKAWAAAAQNYVAEQATKTTGATWENQGPVTIGGRINAIAVKQYDVQETIFIGSASGGILRSRDGGENWTPVFDEQPSLSIGAIFVHPVEPQTILVGTGDPNGSGTSGAFQGTGIYRSTDEGDTWSFLGLPNSASIGRIAVHPQTPETIFAAAMGNLYGDSEDRGLYRSTDNGENWEKVLYLGPTTGALNVVYDPVNPDIVFASLWERYRRPSDRVYFGENSGIYRSQDGGDTWEKLENGFPEGPHNRIGFTVAPSDGSVLYATIVTPENEFLGVYRSLDGGDSWSEVSGFGVNGTGFEWYFGEMVIDPADPHRVFRNGFRLSELNGVTDDIWEEKFIDAHVDCHALWIDPSNPQRMLLGHDGGLSITEDGGTTETTFRNLPITQIYAMEVLESDPEVRFIGAQDNGTNAVNLFDTEWIRVLGGDGFRTTIDPFRDDLFYVEYQYGNLFRFEDGLSDYIKPVSNDRFNWNTPTTTHPTQPDNIFIGGERIYRSTDKGTNWEEYSPSLVGPSPTQGGLAYNTLYDITVSPVDDNIVWAGMDNGRLWLTTDDGNNWTDVSTDLPNRWVSSVLPHPELPQTAYVTYSGYRWDDFTAHVYRTDDGGQSWVNLEGDLPDISVNEIVRDQLNGFLYLATDLGVYLSTNEGVNWTSYGMGLPAVVVNDLRIHQETRKIHAATYGRSTWSADLEEQSSSVNDLNRDIWTTSVFPNPIKNNFTVRFTPDRAQEFTARILDLYGREVQRFPAQRFETGQQDWSLRANDLPGGTYLLQLGDEAGRLVTVTVTSL